VLFVGWSLVGWLVVEQKGPHYVPSCPCYFCYSSAVERSSAQPNNVLQHVQQNAFGITAASPLSTAVTPLSSLPSLPSVPAAPPTDPRLAVQSALRPPSDPRLGTVSSAPIATVASQPAVSPSSGSTIGALGNSHNLLAMLGAQVAGLPASVLDSLLSAPTPASTPPPGFVQPIDPRLAAAKASQPASSGPTAIADAQPSTWQPKEEQRHVHLFICLSIL
jgi:hypothetical protein